MGSSQLPPEQRLFRKVAGRYDDAVAAAFIAVSQAIRGDVSLEAVIAVLEEFGASRPALLYGPLQIKTLAGTFEVDLRPIIERVLDVGGSLAAPLFTDSLGMAPLDMDAFRREAAIAAQEIGAVAIKRIAEGGRQAVKDAVARGFEEGLSASQVATSLVNSIGLDGRRAEAFEKWLKALGEDPPDWSEEELQRQIDLEYKRLLKERAKVVARTELANAAAEGQHVLWGRAVKEGKLNADTWVRVWLRTPRPKACPICDPLRGKRARLIGGYYVSSTGKRYERPPGHPNCQCGERLERAREGDQELPRAKR